MSHEAAPKIGKIYLPALFMRLAEGGDLLFHVQERCYTLLQFSENIQELSLLFSVFVFPDAPGLSAMLSQ